MVDIYEAYEVTGTGPDPIWRAFVSEGTLLLLRTRKNEPDICYGNFDLESIPDLVEVLQEVAERNLDGED